MSRPLLILAKSILTMDRPTPLEDGFVLVSGHRILQVGKRADIRRSLSARLLDLKDTLLLPGLINAHCHLDFTSYKGRVPYRGRFMDWLKGMGMRTKGTAPADFRRSVANGIRESLAHGTTTLCDSATSWESWPLLRRSGLRAFVFPELLDIGQDPAAYWKLFQARLREAVRQFPPTETFRWGLGPHTPFTLSREVLKAAARSLDSGRDLPTSLHVGESRDEGRFFAKGAGPIAEVLKRLSPDRKYPVGTTPVRYLNSLGWLPKLDLGVHLNVLDEKDVRLLAKNRVTVVHCPGSHKFFKHPSFPYRRLRRAGVDVCLGTDSLASNSSLSLFREMRLFAAAHPQVPAREVVAMATVKPAKALGLGSVLGRIRPGSWADLIGIPLRGRGPGSAEKVLSHRGPVSFSMVHGEPRLRLTS